MHHLAGLLVAPWVENTVSRILCGWQHNDSVSEATCCEVNVEMAAFGHVVLLCVAGARFAAASEQEAQVSQRGYVVYPGVQPQVLESAIFQ